MQMRRVFIDVFVGTFGMFPGCFPIARFPIRGKGDYLPCCSRPSSQTAGDSYGDVEKAEKYFVRKLQCRCWKKCFRTERT